MPKNNGHGQASILTPADSARIRKAFQSEHHRLIWDIAIYTGERWGAIVQLLASDVYENAVMSIPRESITFRRNTRKGKDKTRECPVHPELKNLLLGYVPPISGYLFRGDLHGSHLDKSSAFKALKAAIDNARLGHKGYSSHSTRRTFITDLYRKGVDLKTLQQLTGHSDVKNLLRYVDGVSDDRLGAAIALL